jgi:hypothetical protein
MAQLHLDTPPIPTQVTDGNTRKMPVPIKDTFTASQPEEEAHPILTP